MENAPNLPSLEKCPEVHFALFLKARISTDEAHISSSFTASFHPFFAKIWQECCPIMWQKKKRCQGIFLASFESNEYLSKGNACFIKNLR